MTKSKTENSWEKPLGEFITALVLLTHAIVFFQLVVCSKNMVVSFNVPTKNIGIYVSKLSGMRSLLMSVGGATEYGIHKVIKLAGFDTDNTIRKSVSVFSLTCLTITRFIFLIFLYYPDTVSFRNYIVLNIGAFFVGSFQISALAIAKEFAALSWLSVYLSGIFAFVVQAVLDLCWSKRPSLTFKIQSWISLILSVISVGSWAFNLFYLLKKSEESTTTAQPQANGSNTSTTSPPGNGGGGGSGSSSSSAEPPAAPKLRMSYLMTMSSLTILKIMACQLDKLCEGLQPEAFFNVQILITRLQQITDQRQITYDILVAIDLVILALKKCQCSESQLCLLAELSLFLRMKVLIKPLEEQKEDTKIEEVSYSYGLLDVKDCKNGGTGEPVILASGRYMRLIKSEQSQSLSRTRREAPDETKLDGQETGRTRKRVRRETPKCENGTTFDWISPFLMFGTGSLAKDFLFPGVIPYGLLERDKCHLINLIVIIFLSIGPVVIFVMNKQEVFKGDKIYIHSFWSCMIPEIIIFFICLSAIHTKQSSTHKIRSSRWRVFIMTMILLTCYGFLETVNIVGVSNTAKGPYSGDIIATNNIFGKFVRYFVYKLSVGYNKTRIGAGYVLPNFKPPEPITDTFCYWFSGAFSNGWKDIKGDFRMGIKQYLEVS